MPASKRKAGTDFPRSSKRQKESSTIRRRNLGLHIELLGDIMPRACSNCRHAGVECKVHVKSGICGRCHLSGVQKSCDVRITKEEWSRLVSERARLLEEVKRSLSDQKAAEQARREAADREISAREALLEIEAEAEKAIEVEEAQIRALERFEAEQAPKEPSELALSPFTRSLEAGVTDDFWEASSSMPWVLT